jgi:hypothetical protein
MKPNWKEIRESICEGFHEGWKPPKVFIRMYFAPISRGLWRHAIAAGRCGGWRAGVNAFVDGTEPMGRGEIPWW